MKKIINIKKLLLIPGFICVFIFFINVSFSVTPTVEPPGTELYPSFTGINILSGGSITSPDDALVLGDHRDDVDSFENSNDDVVISGPLDVWGVIKNTVNDPDNNNVPVPSEVQIDDYLFVTKSVDVADELSVMGMLSVGESSAFEGDVNIFDGLNIYSDPLTLLSSIRAGTIEVVPGWEIPATEIDGVWKYLNGIWTEAGLIAEGGIIAKGDLQIGGSAMIQGSGAVLGDFVVGGDSYMNGFLTIGYDEFLSADKLSSTAPPFKPILVNVALKGMPAGDGSGGRLKVEDNLYVMSDTDVTPDGAGSLLIGDNTSNWIGIDQNEIASYGSNLHLNWDSPYKVRIGPYSALDVTGEIKNDGTGSATFPSTYTFFDCNKNIGSCGNHTYQSPVKFEGGIDVSEPIVNTKGDWVIMNENVWSPNIESWQMYGSTVRADILDVNLEIANNHPNSITGDVISFNDDIRIKNAHPIRGGGVPWEPVIVDDTLSLTGTLTNWDADDTTFDPLKISDDDGILINGDISSKNSWDDIVIDDDLVVNGDTQINGDLYVNGNPVIDNIYFDRNYKYKYLYAGDSFAEEIGCDPGYYVTGCGFRNPNPTKVLLYRSFPYTSNSCYVFMINNSPSSAGYAYGYAQCMKYN